MTGLLEGWTPGDEVATESKPEMSPGEWDAWLEKAIAAVAGEERRQRDAEVDSLGREAVARHCLVELRQLEGDRSPEAMQAYIAENKGFMDFARTENITAAPATAGSVALYLLNMIADGADPERLRRVVKAINFLHHTNDQPSPCGDFAIEAVLRYGKRRCERNEEDG